jgi:hypothetical protein
VLTKTLSCALLYLFAIAPVFAFNRIATEADRQLYGPYISPGDLIIDTPTKIHEDKRDVIYYFMAKQWPAFREGGTIWIDGDKLGRVNIIKFCNTSNALTPWLVESAKVRNIPNTSVIAEGFVCQGLLNFELNGESQYFPGLSDWPSTRKFLTGAFGFHVIGNLTGGHGYAIDVRDGGTIKLNGFEVQHGFSGVRINGGNHDVIVQSVEISNFYIHDTGNGEGQYLGATHKPPFAKLRNLKIHDGIIARTAAEALQVQHLVGGADVHHVTIFAADVRWMNEFMAGQDTGIQWTLDGGENHLHNILVDGFSSIGIMPFGSGDAAKRGGVSKVSDVLFNDGRDTGIYLHRSATTGIHWIFNNLYFRGFRDNYYAETGRKERAYYISRKWGIDKVSFGTIIHDGSKPRVFEDTAGIGTGPVIVKKLPPPVFRNTGFHEPAHRISQWHPWYAPYFPVSHRDTVKVRMPTQWKAGDIAIETVGEYAFYKCVKSHTSNGTRPADNPCFVRLTWDASAVRSDQRGWNRNSTQSLFPPDDLRLVKDNYWKKLGIGFQEELLDETLSSRE